MHMSPSPWANSGSRPRKPCRVAHIVARELPARIKIQEAASSWFAEGICQLAPGACLRAHFRKTTSGQLLDCVLRAGFWELPGGLPPETAWSSAPEPLLGNHLPENTWDRVRGPAGS